MTYNRLDRSDPGTEVFDRLYGELAEAFSDHESQRVSQDPIFTLGPSYVRLDAARAAMWRWWRENKLERS